MIDKNLSTKEEVYIKNIFHNKVLLKSALKYSHDYHADIENRFQGLNEVKDVEDLNAPTVSPIKINKVKLSATNQNSGSILVSGTSTSTRTLVHETSSSDSIYEEVYLWGYNDSENDIDLTIEFGGLSDNINGNNPSFEITVTDSAGKNQSLKDSPYLRDWAKGYARWLVRAKVKASADDNKMTGTFFEGLSPEETLTGMKDACDMIRQRFENYNDSVL